jgi:hypothetical protein
MFNRFRPGVRPLCVIALALVALLLAACGSSSSSPPPSATTLTSPSAAVAAQSEAVRSRVHRTTKAHPDPVTNGVVTHRPQHGTGGSEINDDNPGRADVGDRSAAGHNPCSLVSRAQAQTILGKAIGPLVEAPLGPTCIYRPVGAKRFVTLTVESIDIARVRAQIRNRTQLDVAGRTAYCGTYGQPTVFVPLASGRVLAVTASCAIGAKFAAEAVPRLGA